PAGDEPASPKESVDAKAPDQPAADAAEDDKSKPTSPADLPVTESWRVIIDGREVLEERSVLGSFQVVVLGRESESFVSEAAADNLRDWVGTESG
ncbi:hypothetical protein ACSTHC_00300, partial [Vibrio parahaemolyticus]